MYNIEKSCREILYILTIEVIVNGGITQDSFFCLLLDILNIGYNKHNIAFTCTHTHLEEYFFKIIHRIPK